MDFKTGVIFPRINGPPGSVLSSMLTLYSCKRNVIFFGPGRIFRILISSFSSVFRLKIFFYYSKKRKNVSLYTLNIYKNRKRKVPCTVSADSLIRFPHFRSKHSQFQVDFILNQKYFIRSCNFSVLLFHFLQIVHFLTHY